MPKSQNQKLKLLYMMKFFLEESDEEHGVTTQQIIDYLAANGISAERKSVYSDIEALGSFGMNIIKRSARPTQYCLVSRQFELAELKLLVDSVQASRFITEKKSIALIKKLEALAGKHGAHQLHRQVFVRDRVKTMNESIYYNVDLIHSAINSGRQISFLYYDYTVGREKRYRRGGAKYTVSPYLLSWDDEKYYLVAYDSQSAQKRHYRVDKMLSISVLDAPREGGELFTALDAAKYDTIHFGMFSGEERRVTLRFTSRLAGAVIDRFGSDAILVPDGEEHFTVTLSVAVSPQFFGWLCGFGNEAELLSPQDTRLEFKKYLHEITSLYAPQNGE